MLYTRPHHSLTGHPLLFLSGFVRNFCCYPLCAVVFCSIISLSKLFLLILKGGEFSVKDNQPTRVNGS